MPLGKIEFKMKSEGDEIRLEPLREGHGMLTSPPEKSPLYDVVCQKCNHHQVTRNPQEACVKCSSLLISVTPAKGTVMTR